MNDMNVVKCKNYLYDITKWFWSYGNGNCLYLMCVGCTNDIEKILITNDIKFETRESIISVNISEIESTIRNTIIDDILN